MRYWQPSTSRPAELARLPALIEHLGTPQFQTALLAELHDLIPAASYAIYRTGTQCQPRLFMSGSYGVQDRTQDCWKAYCQGLHLNDQTLPAAASSPSMLWMSHITAPEVPAQHRQAIYEAHALSERISLHKPLAQGGVLALNYYRHDHQPAFRDSHIANFETMAAALLALVEKHLQWSEASAAFSLHSRVGAAPHTADWRQQLHQQCPALTTRELDVCTRLLQGMTYEGIASDLQLSLPTVKTYRNRAFQRLGIHYRNQLFARIQAPSAAQPVACLPATQLAH